jgi:penicillin-binding protein 2
MGLKDFYEDKKFVLGRLPFIQYSAIAVFVFLFLGIWNLQILKSKYYKEQAEKNQVRSITLTAPRGKIIDRNGQIIVDNRPSFTVSLTRENLPGIEGSLITGLRIKTGHGFKTQIDRPATNLATFPYH